MANTLERRSSLTIWFDPEMTREATPTAKRRRQPDYSGEGGQKTVQWTVFPTNAIQTCLTMKGEGRPEICSADRFQP